MALLTSQCQTLCCGSTAAGRAALWTLWYSPVQLLVQLPGGNGIVWRKGSVGAGGWGQVEDMPVWLLTSCSFNSTLGLTVTPLWMRVPGPGFALPHTSSRHLHRCNKIVKHCYPHPDMLVPFCVDLSGQISLFRHNSISSKAFLVYFSWDDFAHVPNKTSHILLNWYKGRWSFCIQENLIWYKRCNGLLQGGWMNVWLKMRCHLRPLPLCKCSQVCCFIVPWSLNPRKIHGNLHLPCTSRLSLAGLICSRVVIPGLTWKNTALVEVFLVWVITHIQQFPKNCAYEEMGSLSSFWTITNHCW